MTIFEKLQKKIKEDLNINVINLQRLGGGYWHKANGGLSWVGIIKETNQQIGSTITATELLKKEKLEIIPDEVIGTIIEIL